MNIWRLFFSPAKKGPPQSVIEEVEGKLRHEFARSDAVHRSATRSAKASVEASNRAETIAKKTLALLKREHSDGEAS
jgi:hypothetical protein